MSPPTASPPPNSYLVSQLVRSTDVRPPPNACLSSESRCHLRSRQPLALASASPVTHGCALHRAGFRRSREPWPPNDAGTDAPVGRSQDPGGPPSAQCSCAYQATAIPCSSSSKARAGLRAPRRSPGPLYMPRSVSLVGLARRGVIPQNNSTSECSFCDPVIVVAVSTATYGHLGSQAGRTAGPTSACSRGRQAKACSTGLLSTQFR